MTEPSNKVQEALVPPTDYWDGTSGPYLKTAPDEDIPCPVCGEKWWHRPGLWHVVCVPCGAQFEVADEKPSWRHKADRITDRLARVIFR